MRILYLHRTQGEEPESIHINAIVGALRDLGHEVSVVGPARLDAAKPDADQRSSLRTVKRLVPGAVFELLQLAYNAVILWNLRRTIREFRPDFIYERYALYGFAGVMTARRLGIPLILEVNTPYAQAWAQFYGLTFRRLARWIERRIFRAADHIITVTHVQSRMLVEEGVATERITVCHNAIDPSWFDPALHENPLLRERLALGEVVVGFVGTMNRWQGIPEFPKAIDAVLRQHPSVSFLFVGEGEFRAALEEECRARGYLDRVRFVGRRAHQEIPSYVRLMDIAVLLNSNDYGSPMKIFEYWGMQKAVVAPAVEPVTEVLRDGETGLLIPRGDAIALSERIDELVRDARLRTALGKNGRDYVLANHTWAGNAQRILDAYQMLSSHPA
jgi:glycosyltransferase involved in cell wall biosynthesis